MLFGAAGAFVRSLIKDGSLSLPYISDRSLKLGFVGGMIIGAFVGFLVDHSALTALLAGYVGTSSISHLLPKDPIGAS